jgi:hypothetical protein
MDQKPVDAEQVRREQKASADRVGAFSDAVIAVIVTAPSAHNLHQATREVTSEKEKRHDQGEISLSRC